MAEQGRFVFDTNVIVSALLIKASVARRSLDKAREAGIILLSLDVIGELRNVLSRPDFDRYVDEEDRIQFLTLLIKEADMVEIAERIAECRDPKDDKFLELAVNGKLDTLAAQTVLCDHHQEFLVAITVNLLYSIKVKLARFFQFLLQGESHEQDP